MRRQCIDSELSSLKDLIRNGDYTVSGEDVAEALLLDHLFFAVLDFLNDDSEEQAPALPPRN